MKILHISSSYWPAFEMGGPIESVHQLNKWLSKKGVEVTVYTTNAGLKNKENIVLGRETGIDGVKVFYFPYYGYIHWTFSPVLCWAIRKNIKNFDLIHITGVWNFPVIAAAFWARFYKKPYIISPRGSLMKEPLAKKSSFKKRLYFWLISKRDFKNAAAIHFTVEAEKEEYLKAGLPFKKTVVIPNSIDISGYEIQNQYETKLIFRDKFGINAGKKIILFFGRLHWIKGLDTLIPAFAEVVKKEPNAVLVLAGPDNDYQGEVLKFINGINIRTSDVHKLRPLILRTSDVQNIKDANVIFTGMLLGNDKIAAYRESDVFVLPSYSENFGMAVVEAMYFGLPVVITKGVGISPSINKVGAGIVIEKNEKQLTEAILKILNNPDLAKKMGENGRKLVEKEFSCDGVAEKWIKEYNNLFYKSIEL